MRLSSIVSKKLLLWMPRKEGGVAERTVLNGTESEQRISWRSEAP